MHEELVRQAVQRCYVLRAENAGVVADGAVGGVGFAREERGGAAVRGGDVVAELPFLVVEGVAEVHAACQGGGVG